MVDVSVQPAEPATCPVSTKDPERPTGYSPGLPPPVGRGVHQALHLRDARRFYCLVVCVGEGRTRKMVAENPTGYAKNMTKRGRWQVPCGSKGRNSARSALRSTVAKACQLSKA